MSNIKIESKITIKIPRKKKFFVCEECADNYLGSAYIPLSYRHVRYQKICKVCKKPKNCIVVVTTFARTIELEF